MDYTRGSEEPGILGGTRAADGALCRWRCGIDERFEVRAARGRTGTNTKHLGATTSRESKRANGAGFPGHDWRAGAARTAGHVRAAVDERRQRGLATILCQRTQAARGAANVSVRTQTLLAGISN